MGVLIASQCPRHPRDVAEAYLLGHITEAEGVMFRRHYLSCPRCRHALQEESEIIRALRSAGRMIAASEPPPQPATKHLANGSAMRTRFSTVARSANFRRNTSAITARCAT